MAFDDFFDNNLRARSRAREKRSRKIQPMCRKIATLLAGYIPQGKVPSASSSEKLVNCEQ